MTVELKSTLPHETKIEVVFLEWSFLDIFIYTTEHDSSLVSTNCDTLMLPVFPCKHFLLV